FRIAHAQLNGVREHRLRMSKNEVDAFVFGATSNEQFYVRCVEFYKRITEGHGCDGMQAWC
ncbi:MAG: hypothetical protein ACKO66_06370, partial [Flavobacteriales bacterium]